MATKPTALHQLLARLEDILKLLKEGKGSSEGSEVASAQLQRLAEQLHTLTVQQTTAFKQAHIDPNTLVQQIIDAPQADPALKEWLEKTRQIAGEIHQFQEAVDQAIKANPRDQQQRPARAQQKIRERRKLFRTLGSDDQWRPL